MFSLALHVPPTRPPVLGLSAAALRGGQGSVILSTRWAHPHQQTHVHYSHPTIPNTRLHACTHISPRNSHHAHTHTQCTCAGTSHTRPACCAHTHRSQGLGKARRAGGLGGGGSLGHSLGHLVAALQGGDGRQRGG